jgi:hypothetical protein
MVTTVSTPNSSASCSAPQHAVIAGALDRVQGVPGAVERLQPQAAGGDVALQCAARTGVGEQLDQVGMRGGRPPAVLSAESDRRWRS